MAKIAKLAERYIADHPQIGECLAMDMVNYSKLARKIGKELRIRQTAAIVAACRRYAYSLRSRKREPSGIELLKQSEKTIKVSNRKAMLTFRISEKMLPKVIEAIR